MSSITGSMFIDATFPTGDVGMTSCSGRPGTWQLGAPRSTEAVRADQLRCNSQAQAYGDGSMDRSALDANNAANTLKDTQLSQSFLEDIVSSRNKVTQTEPPDAQKCFNASLPNISTIKMYCNKWDGTPLTLQDVMDGCSTGYINAACEGYNFEFMETTAYPNVYRNTEYDTGYVLSSTVASRMPLTHILKTSENADCVKNGIGFVDGQLTCVKSEIDRGNTPEHILDWESKLEALHNAYTCVEIADMMKQNNIKCSFDHPDTVAAAIRQGKDAYSLIQDWCVLDRRIDAVCYNPANQSTFHVSKPLNGATYFVYNSAQWRSMLGI